MVVDSIANINRFKGLNPRIEAALRFLKNQDFSTMEPQRIDISGEEVYALVQKYDTRPENECKWESHRRFVDIQFIAAGRERIGWAIRDLLKVKTTYNETKDQTVHEGSGAYLTLTEGYFAILWPEDAHMPCLAVDEPEPVVKVVVKVQL